jgi:phosphoribosylglycinamide formyltransferase-1
MRNIAIFASGSGTNAENIIKHFSDKKDAKVTLVLTENPNAFVLERAKNQHVPTLVFSLEELKGGSILHTLKQQNIDYIVLAGFLKLIPSDIIEAFPNRIINIHPALLPKFGGKGMYGNKVHQAVIESGEKESGITIHYVNKHYDEGSIIFQAKCPVLENDTPELLAQRIHNLEYINFPKVIEDLILGEK